MASYDVAITRRGGFSSLTESRAHHLVVGKLSQQVELARSVANDCREIDRAEIGTIGSDLYKDLAAGKGRVIMLSQPEGSPLFGAELTYNPADDSIQNLVVQMGENKLTQKDSTYKLEEKGITTFFRHDEARGVFTIMDGETEIPRIFGGVDPRLLTADTPQPGQPIPMF